MAQPHIAILTFPAYGAVNPSLQMAKNLAKMGVKVTFVTSISAQRRMADDSATPQGLSIFAFNDGYDDGVKLSDDQKHFRSQLISSSSKALSQLFMASSEEGYPVTRLVYSMIMSWAPEVARAFNIPSAALWIQPASVFCIYFHYFNGYGDAITRISSNPSNAVKLSGLPEITSRDLPTFFLPSNPFFSFLSYFKEQLDVLDAETKPKVLMNTFDALETEALRAVEKYNLLPVGPLVPSPFLDGNDFERNNTPESRYYHEWLDSKPQKSVIYISFGTVVVLSEQQMEEIARALLESHRPFLWVIRTPKIGDKQEDRLGCREELEKQGVIVPWCSQVEVLTHPSLGCFVTHCGWNSTLEGLVSGIPMVSIPQLTDQTTNAKLIEDAFKAGVRPSVNEEGIAKADEIKRCIELVMGDSERGEEIRTNAKKWKDLAKDAVKEGGSSDINLKAFVNDLEGGFN